MTTEKRVLYCTDLANEPGKPKCCDSCHDDHASGYTELLERYDDPQDEERMTHLVCCTVNDWLEKQRDH